MRVDTKENSVKKKGKRKTGKQLWIAYALRTITLCVILLLLIAIWKMIASMVNKPEEMPKDVMVREQVIEVEGPEEPIVPADEAEKSITVWLDAGHGGKDVGSDIREIYEKEINIAIVNKIQEILEEEDYEILLTRNGDETVKLYERVDLVNEAKADLFVSVHCNSVAEDYVNGIETYYADGKKKGKILAQYLQDAAVAETGAKDRGIESGNLVVLNYTNMPAALIEVGFLTNEVEYQNLIDSDYQDKLAKAIAEGIKKFISEELSE